MAVSYNWCCRNSQLLLSLLTLWGVHKPMADPVRFGTLMKILSIPSRDGGPNWDEKSRQVCREMGINRISVLSVTQL